MLLASISDLSYFSYNSTAGSISTSTNTCIYIHTERDGREELLSWHPQVKALRNVINSTEKPKHREEGVLSVSFIAVSLADAQLGQHSR